MVNMITPKLREEIGLKFKKVKKNPNYFQKRKELCFDEARSLGDIYSFWIENPELRKALLMERRIPKTLKKQARKGIQNIHNAWYFLSQKGNEEIPFIEQLDEDILIRVNKLIEPQESGAGDFRKKDATLDILGYAPSSWEGIPEKVKKVLSLARQKYLKDPLEAAIYLHLGLSSIQPFREGNKRTARLIQDRVLYDEGYPPAIIEAGEGTFYHNLFVESFKAYKDNDLGKQVQFYDYCASKVNNCLDKVLDDLDIR
ncbi:MAG: Fic family protein [Nanoarchaeota archaeon]|nr:Fic family protein [Nanoarchaeota archaeon]